MEHAEDVVVRGLGTVAPGGCQRDGRRLLAELPLDQHFPEPPLGGITASRLEQIRQRTFRGDILEDDGACGVEGRVIRLFPALVEEATGLIEVAGTPVDKCQVVARPPAGAEGRGPLQHLGRLRSKGEDALGRRGFGLP